MEAKDYITALGVLVVMLGWFVAKMKDRDQEKLKARIARREQLAKAFMEVDDILLRTQGKIESDPAFTNKWLVLASLTRLYGTKKENEKLIAFTENFFAKKELESANRSYNDLKQSLIKSVREELGFDTL